MNQEAEIELRSKCPLVTRKLKNFSCGEGWVQVVRRALDQLEGVARQDIEAFPRRQHLVITEVASVGGYLRLVTSRIDPDVTRILAAAVAESARLCESCGRRRARRLCDVPSPCCGDKAPLTD